MLYHGSIEVVANPEIREPNRTLDYGSGFYTTTSFRQAEEWVRQKIKEIGKEKGYVNVYDFQKDAMKGLNCLMFDAPTEEWLDFVMKNRTQKGFTHPFRYRIWPRGKRSGICGLCLIRGWFP